MFRLLSTNRSRENTQEQRYPAGREHALFMERDAGNFELIWRQRRSVQKLERRDLRPANRPLDDARWWVSVIEYLQE
jgi:hypothetical protein